MHLYGFSIAAVRRVGRSISFESNSGTLVASTKEEALGKALKTCNEVFPWLEGYHSHKATVTEAPESQIKEVIASMS